MGEENETCIIAELVRKYFRVWRRLRCVWPYLPCRPDAMVILRRRQFVPISSTNNRLELQRLNR